MSRSIAARIAAGIIANLTVVCLHAQEPPPSSPPDEQTRTRLIVSTSRPAGDAAERIDPKVDVILTRMEERKLADVQANVAWTVRWVLDEEDEAVTKIGTLWYKDDQPTAKFLIKLHKKIVGGRGEDLDEQHMFDGGWLVELQGRANPGVVIRRQLQPAGAVGNPFKFGEGPFPVPFGQSKADILKEFSVAHVPPAKDDPPGTDHLQLIAREGSRIGRDYRSVDLWIVRDEKGLVGLPIQVKAAKKDGTGQVNSIITVKFTDPSIDRGLAGVNFRIDTPQGFQEIIEPLGGAPKAP